MRLVDIKQLSEFLSVKESTLYSWANSGAIPAYKINGVWRFDMDEITVWVKKRAKHIMDPSQKTASRNNDNLDIDSVVRRAIDGAHSRNLLFRGQNNRMRFMCQWRFCLILPGVYGGKLYNILRQGSTGRDAGIVLQDS